MNLMGKALQMQHSFITQILNLQAASLNESLYKTSSHKACILPVQLKNHINHGSEAQKYSIQKELTNVK